MKEILLHIIILEELNPKDEKELLNFKEAYEFLVCSAFTLNRWKVKEDLLDWLTRKDLKEISILMRKII